MTHPEPRAVYSESPHESNARSDVPAEPRLRLHAGRAASGRARNCQRQGRDCRPRARRRHQGANRRRRRHAHPTPGPERTTAAGLHDGTFGWLRAARCDHERRGVFRVRRTACWQVRPGCGSVRVSRRRVSHAVARRARPPRRARRHGDAGHDQDLTRASGVHLWHGCRRARRADAGRARHRISTRGGRRRGARARGSRRCHRRSRHLPHRAARARQLHRRRRVDVDDDARGVGDGDRCGRAEPERGVRRGIKPLAGRHAIAQRPSQRRGNARRSMGRATSRRHAAARG